MRNMILQISTQTQTVSSSQTNKSTQITSMFKTFERSEVSTSSQVKASVQRGIKAQLVAANPRITDEEWDALLPKKPPLVQYKVGSHMMLYCRRIQHGDEDDKVTSSSDEPVFFQHRDGPILPTLRIVNRYPTLNFTSVTVDKGAIPFILGGANIMCPGLTKPNQSSMPPDGIEQDASGFDKPGLAKGDGVLVRAEGKDSAIAIGVMAMSSAEIREKNKGNGIDVAHFLGDGLFLADEL